MGKTSFPTTRKAQKWEKQAFQLLGRLKNEKNKLSNYLEDSKMRKTILTALNGRNSIIQQT